MCVAAVRANRNMNTAQMGSSSVVVGVNPRPAVVGGYGLWFDIMTVGTKKIEIEVEVEIENKIQA